MIKKIHTTLLGADRRLLGIVPLLLLLAGLDLNLRVLHSVELGQLEEPPVAPTAIHVDRPPPGWSSLFAAPKEETILAPTRLQAIDEATQEGDLSAIVINEEAFTLRACFLKQGTSAVALVAAEAQANATPLRLLHINDSLGPYKVTEISHKSITLEAETGRKAVLRLFAPQNSNS